MLRLNHARPAKRAVEEDHFENGSANKRKPLKPKEHKDKRRKGQNLLSIAGNVDVDDLERKRKSLKYKSDEEEQVDSDDGRQHGRDDDKKKKRAHQKHQNHHSRHHHHHHSGDTQHSVAHAQSHSRSVFI